MKNYEKQYRVWVECVEMCAGEPDQGLCFRLHWARSM